MPRGSGGERPAADVIGNAAKVMRIAAGEETETLPVLEQAGRETGKDACRRARD